MANEKKRLTAPLPLVTLILLGFILAFVALVYSPETDPEPASWVGLEAPDFPIGEKTQTRMLSDLRGKVVLLNFWAFWCEPCLDEIPSLKKLEDRFGKGDFQVVMVHVGDERNEVLKIPGLPLIQVFDATSGVLGLFGVSGLPHSFLIDKQGTVRGEYKGPRDWMSPSIQKEIQEALGQPRES